ncbi:MAG TPA: hypothetical protein VGC89_22370 [Pyrinomonadaceae bacterium]|jgi:hypothetical protein
MNRMERRAGWLARHRQQALASAPDASHSVTQNAARNLRAHASEPPALATTAAAPASVNLHIEEMVLHGFAPRDRYRIGDAVQRELARLLTTQGAPSALSASGEQARVNAGSFNAGSFNVTPGAEAKSVGRGVAQAVYGELKR